MSCGKPHETDCTEVLAEVWLFLDNECDRDRRALLARHLDECAPCLAEYGLEEKLKRLLAAKCGGEQAPATLREHLRVVGLVVVPTAHEVTSCCPRRNPRSRAVSVRRSRSCRRPRCSRDITVPIGVPMMSAISL